MLLPIFEDKLEPEEAQEATPTYCYMADEETGRLCDRPVTRFVMSLAHGRVGCCEEHFWGGIGRLNSMASYNAKMGRLIEINGEMGNPIWKN